MLKLIYYLCFLNVAYVLSSTTVRLLCIALPLTMHLSLFLSLSQLLSLRYILNALYLHSVKCGAGVFQRFCFALRTLLLFVVVFL